MKWFSGSNSSSSSSSSSAEPQLLKVERLESTFVNRSVPPLSFGDEVKARRSGGEDVIQEEEEEEKQSNEDVLQDVNMDMFDSSTADKDKGKNWTFTWKFKMSHFLVTRQFFSTTSE